MRSGDRGLCRANRLDAREHGWKVTILASACATTDEELERLALAYAEQVGGIRVGHFDVHSLDA